jgi:hypothetical protein
MWTKVLWILMMKRTTADAARPQPEMLLLLLLLLKAVAGRMTFSNKRLRFDRWNFSTVRTSLAPVKNCEKKHGLE